MGRFNQRDSYLGETEHPISQNRYTYAWNNPNKYIDKSGNRPLTGEEGYDNSPEAYYQARIMQYIHDYGVDWDTAEWAIANSLMHNEGPYKTLAQDSYLRLYDKFGNVPGYKPPGGDSVVNITDEELAASEAAQKKLEEELVAEIARAEALGLKVPDLSSLDIYEKLAYLRQLRKICDEIEAGYISVEDAQKQVDDILGEPAINLFDLLINVINWQDAYKEIGKAFSTGFKTNFNLLNFIKSADNWNYKVSYSGARNAVKNLTGLATGPLSNLSTSLGKSLKSQFSMDNFFPGIKFFIGPAIEFFVSGVQLLLGIISTVRLLSNVLASIIYEGLKLIGSALIKGVLAPFLGPFAWLVSWLAEVAFDILDMLIDIQGFISTIVQNIIINFQEEIMYIINSICQ